MKRWKLLVLMLVIVPLATAGCGSTWAHIVAPVIVPGGLTSSMDLHVDLKWSNNGNAIPYADIRTLNSADHTRTDSNGHADLLTRSTDTQETIVVTIADNPKQWTVGLQRGGTSVTLYY